MWATGVTTPDWWRHVTLICRAVIGCYSISGSHSIYSPRREGQENRLNLADWIYLFSKICILISFRRRMSINDKHVNRNSSKIILWSRNCDSIYITILFGVIIQILILDCHKSVSMTFTRGGRGELWQKYFLKFINCWVVSPVVRYMSIEQSSDGFHPGRTISEQCLKNDNW